MFCSFNLRLSSFLLINVCIPVDCANYPHIDWFSQGPKFSKTLSALLALLTEVPPSRCFRHGWIMVITISTLRFLWI